MEIKHGVRVGRAERDAECRQPDRKAHRIQLDAIGGRGAPYRGLVRAVVLAGFVPAMRQELPLARAGKVDFDQIDARPAALRLLLLVFLQAISRRLVGRRHELDHRNHAPPGAQVDDLKKALDDRFRLGSQNDRLRHGDSARWLDG